MKKLFILFFLPVFCFGQNYTHKLDSVITYKLDSNYNHITHDKTTFVYDANNNQTLHTFILGIVALVLVETYKYEYTYDANNNQTLDARYTWDSSTSSWEIAEV